MFCLIECCCSRQNERTKTKTKPVHFSPKNVGLLFWIGGNTVTSSGKWNWLIWCIYCSKAHHQINKLYHKYSECSCKLRHRSQIKIILRERRSSCQLFGLDEVGIWRNFKNCFFNEFPISIGGLHWSFILRIFCKYLLATKCKLLVHRARITKISSRLAQPKRCLLLKIYGGNMW